MIIVCISTQESGNEFKVFTEILEVHPEYQIYSIDSQKERLVARDIYKQKEMPTQIFF